MGICNTVKAMAEALRDAKAPADPKQQLMIEILRLMPMYIAMRDLSVWESAYQDAESSKMMPRLQDDVGEALEHIFEFGRFNLYCALRANETERQLELTIDTLRELGVPYSGPRDVRTW
jgi:hypothetical protein